ncbi:hypothetical protein F4820DRAFT_190942 [Hypoxylon rubiginosum]|uniref:Uncharacterized protein n=1 Tax=Hypoxylon rubiginosum TaxID=110542 RepID=A0ACB9Z8X1_9PEZI|nr:hypothetical protein F4820DRAFT_190942 [Hypoxylon rubiginosum]
MSEFSVSKSILPLLFGTMASHSEELNILRGTGAWSQFVHASSKNTAHAVGIPQTLDTASLEDDDLVGINADSGVTGAPKAWEPVFDNDFWHGFNGVTSVDERPICHSSTQSGISSSSANQTSLS